MISDVCFKVFISDIYSLQFYKQNGWSNTNVQPLGKSMKYALFLVHSHLVVSATVNFEIIGNIDRLSFGQGLHRYLKIAPLIFSRYLVFTNKVSPEKALQFKIVYSLRKILYLSINTFLRDILFFKYK